MIRKALAVMTVLCLSATIAVAEVKVAAIFGDHMVLQVGMDVPVWGVANPGEEVTVRFAGQTKKATTGKDSKWRVILDPLKVSAEGREIKITGTSELLIKDVLVGEVWLCSGQSNMQWSVNVIRGAKAEIAAAEYPLIRHNRSKWEPCSPQTVGGFSATAYFFGRYLHKKLGVPVGLINRSVGGTAIEFWMPSEDLMPLDYAKKLHKKYNTPEMKAAFKVYVPLRAEYYKKRRAWAAARQAGDKEAKPPIKPPIGNLNGPETVEFAIYFSNSPGNLYRRLIKPVVGCAIRGAIWYQGERNARTTTGPYEYRRLLPVMIKSWRRVWGQGDFPFLYVQLPNYNKPSWPMIRESMLKVLSVPKTGMAVTIDIGEERNIHPHNKQEVGKRLGLIARSVAYGENLVYMGPLYKDMKIEGNRAILSFTHVGGGLAAKDGPLTGFVVAGADKKFVKAGAKIEGDTVVISAKEVQAPVAVRYGWEANPKCNLYNRENLPASPFRTDTWEQLEN